MSTGTLFSYDAPELQCTEGSEIASMCKAKHFSYHRFVVSLDDFKETEPGHKNAVDALHLKVSYHLHDASQPIKCNDTD
jgi:hypothetical protein